MPQKAIQPMDLTSLQAVLMELRPLLVPARFEKAQQSGGQAVQLALRSLQGVHWLELSWRAEAPLLLAIPPPAREGEGSTLARQLQHGLRGLALVGLEQHGWERVVELVFSRRPGEPGRRFLVLELMGRHSNLFLLDEQRQVIALARQIRQEQSRLRPIGTGDPYCPPPPMAGDGPLASEAEAQWRRRLSLLPIPLGRALREAYQGIGPALARQLVAGVDGGNRLLELPVQDLQEDQWRQLHVQWQRWLKAVSEERFGLWWGGASDYRCWEGGEPGPACGGNPDRDAPDPLAINRGLAAYYGTRLAERQLEQRRQALRQQLQATAAKEERSIQRFRSALAEVAGSEELQGRADALLSRPSPGREEIDEAQKLYRKARKLRRSVAAITPRLEAQGQRLAWLETSLTFLEQADGAEQVAALEEELGEDLLREGRVPRERARRRQGGASPSAPQPLELRTPAGARLLVGRNHRQNEWISLRQARRGDLWFHAQECPGSHVVLKGSERPPGEEDLLSAADLAAHFSRARGNARVAVVMVPTDQLQRIPGAAAGTVRHHGGEILWGEPERARLLLQPS